MTTRRDFLQRAALLTSGAFVRGSIPEAIARALAIDPPANTTFRDAEHVVILMQENRSFDHIYGALRGVRGFRDPRVHTQPNGRPVWFQSDATGDTYVPFRLDIDATNATWIGGLPHTWPDQIDARNGGRYNQWLIAKPKRDLPFTLGHYARSDIPFYYALADAFTVCDQAFCSSLTGTTANRLFFWTGTIRRDANDVARVMNEDTVYDREAAWPTFPERLEQAGVSWRIYQNDVSIPSGLTDEEDAWLSSFGDNPLEWFTQYNVRFTPSRRRYLPAFLAATREEIRVKETAAVAPNLTPAARAKLEQELAALRAAVTSAEAERAQYTDDAWRALSGRERSIHERAFTTNADDPDYRMLSSLGYDDHGTRRELPVPRGDVLHRFRRDVATGSLPAVSWLVAPQQFSDHPSSAWFGAWYVSEVLNVLTQNPEVWKKAVFILCYDENDGYFDHVPPFVAPHPARPETGRVSSGIDTSVEWASVYGRESSIGLGYRVPLVIASPWSRGGAVNSQVFDHTSVIQFVETWLAAKGTHVREANISDWRRLVCGDLTSAFRPYDGEPIALPRALGRDETVERIYSAKFRERPHGSAPLSQEDVASANVRALQEPGTRPACPLPYELVVNGDVRNGALTLAMTARREAFGAASQGAAFNVYSYLGGDEMSARAYAVRAGDTITDSIPIASEYRVRIDGPNGFMRELSGAGDPAATVHLDHAGGQAAGGRLELTIANRATSARSFEIRDESYGSPVRQLSVAAGSHTSIVLDTAATHGWYDVAVAAEGLRYRYAGRVESGKWTTTDPAMG